MKKLIILALTFLLDKIKGKSLPNGNTYYWGIGTYFIIVLLAMMIAGCNNDDLQNEYAKSVTESDFAILEFDSCEYLLRVTPYNGFLSHKGNCKYCATRRKAELKELVKQLKEK